MDKQNDTQTLLTVITDSVRDGRFVKAVFSKPSTDKSCHRLTMVPMTLKGETVIQIQTLRDADCAKTVNRSAPVTASQTNVSPSSLTETLPETIGRFDRINLFLRDAQYEFMRSKGGKTRLTVHTSPASLPAVAGSAAHDRAKQYILSGSEPFLIALGVSDASGKVHDKKQAKYRQINRFLELIRDVTSRLPESGRIHVLDLCCGKSYLSFAVYHYLCAVCRREVDMVGVDMKADVMEDCNRIASSCSMTGLSFVCADVSTYTPPFPVDMVISLHACDVATDFVIDRALALDAPVILSTPCCHHALNASLNCPDLSFIADYSMLRQKFCDAATDALRLLRMRAYGYDTVALELVDPEETPKNVMLRGIKKYPLTHPKSLAARAEYNRMLAYLTGTDTGFDGMAPLTDVSKDTEARHV